MKRARISVSLLAASLGMAWQTAVPPKPAATPVAEAGPHEVASFVETWRDAERERDVPVKIWHPREGSELPVIVFSHGLGGSREGYAFLGKHWASHGYVSVHLQHLGSDEAVWRDARNPMLAMQRAARDLDNLLNRPADVSFAIDELARRNADEEWKLKGRLKLDAVAVAGHSFGSYTALCAVGRVLIPPIGASRDLRDSRVKCALAMSSPASEREARNGSYASITVPCFHMTGTRDDSPIGDTSAAQRRIPYDASTAAPRYLLVLDGAEHNAFSDSALGLRDRDPADHLLILASSTRFFDAHLRGDEKALEWLRDGGFAEMLGDHGKFEHAAPEPAAAPDDR